MRTRRPIAALFLATFLALAGCSADAGEGEGSDAPEQSEGADDGGAGEEITPPEVDLDDVPDVVAEVNGEEIDRDQFVTTYEGQLQQAFMMQQTTGEEVDTEELKTQVADQLVNNLLLMQAADSAGIEASNDDVDTALEELGAQNGFDTLEEVLSAFEEQGLSEEVVREDAASQVMINAYLDQEMRIEEPSEEELQEQYDELLEQLQAQGQEPGDDDELPPFEEVRDLLADEATREQKNSEVSRILEGLHEDADVTIHL